MPDELPVPDAVAGLRAANARLRGLLAERDAEIAALRERDRLLELRLAELERRLGMDSTNSGTPTSKEGIAPGAAEVGAGAQEGPQAGRAARP